MPPTPPNQRAGELHEVFLADLFGGAKTRGSGSQWFDQGDVRNNHDIPFAFCADGKSTRGKQVAVTLEMIAKIREQAQGERPALGLRWYANDNLDKVTEDLVAIGAEDFRELLDAARQWAELQRHPAIIVKPDDGMSPEELERFREEFEEAVRQGGLSARVPPAPEGEDSSPDLEPAMAEIARLREELARYRAGKVIPPYVPRLPWTIAFQVRLPGARSFGMRYDADGAVTQFEISEVRVERHMGNRPRLVVNNLLVHDGDLYVDGVLEARAWRDNRDGEAG
jgi:hypothetical protein